MGVELKQIIINDDIKQTNIKDVIFDINKIWDCFF